MPKVIVGLSGGVDSSIAALLLKKQGYQVHAVFMNNWHEPADVGNTYCTAAQDLKDAQSICNTLEIPLETIDFSDQYWDKVFEYFLSEYTAGRTPNPDILCNKEIKFKAFLDYAVTKGYDFIATGHYAIVQKTTSGDYQLRKGIDSNKDQSYFLYTLNQWQLSHSLFPIGALEKSKVREMAKSEGLITHNKKDSTGICFIGKRKFQAFLSEYVLAKPGDIQTSEGKIIGKHEGFMFYTIGQRKGLNIGGKSNTDEKPWYVADKDMEKNRLIVVQGHDHPLLFTSSLYCKDLHWVNQQPPGENFKVSAKIRYRQIEQACQIKRIDSNCYKVQFKTPQWAVTPGQSIVFYQGDVCLGGGIISSYLKDVV